MRSLEQTGSSATGSISTERDERRTCLIVSPYFPPSSLAGVHRARLISRHLPAFGWEPVLEGGNVIALKGEDGAISLEPAGQFELEALLDAQELDSRAGTGTVYWEGLAELRDASQRRVGSGYLEMTGYAGRLRLGD